MIHLTRGAVVLGAVLTLVFQTASDAQQVLWEMDARRFDQRELGEIRPRSTPRLEPLSNPRGMRRDGPAFLTERPAVIDLGPFREPRNPTERRHKHER